MSIIEQIRAEIERLRKDRSTPHPGKWYEGYHTALRKLSSSLDTLEEEPVELEKEMDDYFEKMTVHSHENIFEETYHNIARHFAQWGAEHLKK